MVKIKIPKFRKYKNVNYLRLAVVFSIPAFVLWFSGFVTYIWINILSRLLASLPSLGQTLLFLVLPFIATILSVVANKQKSTKLTKSLVLVNILFVALVIIASFK